MKPIENNIPKEKFQFAKQNDTSHDKKLDTKPVSYLKDAFSRFKKNKASITASIIIGILILFALIVPIFSKYTVAYNDINYSYTLPKNELFYSLGIDFWDGCQEKELKGETFYRYYAMGLETGHYAIKNQDKGGYEIIETVDSMTNKKVKLYKFRLDTYQYKGVVFMDVTPEQYQSIQKYQDETGIQVIYPITDPEKRPTAVQDLKEANYWYETNNINGKTALIFDSKGEPVFNNIYLAYNGKDDYTSIVRIDENNEYAYAVQNSVGYEIRVNYYEYYIYYHSYFLKDKITKPSFVFGTTSSGQDIFTCLASGARFSFILAILVASVNLFVGAIYGSIEGYYGGKIDLAMERFSDILSAVPFMIVITLLKYHMKNTSHVLLLFISFFLTGWIGMASRTRMQFYRFKNQEYVYAARTLGANDRRIMFKHIFPNAIGTLITGSVLVIPSVIFSETSLSYLGIINLNTGNLTSVGTLLAGGQAHLITYPHIIFFPALFISLLMLSFNLFGNGLRDAFNPSLRGTDE